MASTQQELRLQISHYALVIDTKEDRFAHNIVRMCLARIAYDYGVAAANEAIEDFGLEALGFSKRDVPEKEGD